MLKLTAIVKSAFVNRTTPIYYRLATLEFYLQCPDSLPDTTNVNYTLVKEGWSWWYRKYLPGNTVLEGLEKATREAKRACRSILHPFRRGVLPEGLAQTGYSATFGDRAAV